jgi:cytochrome c oxidase assembly factor CtaG
MLRRLSGALLALAIPSAAAAHVLDPDPIAPPRWSFEPLVVVPLALSVVLFAVGWARLRARSSQGRPGIDRRAGLFGLGIAILAGALMSPLHEAGGRSFTAHMVEHELLMLVAAPLLAWSRPLSVMIWSFPASGRRGMGALGRVLSGTYRSLTHPVTATLIQASALWLWHAPALFDLALSSNFWHVVQHLCFLVSALLFWSAMLDRRHGVGVTAVCLFATSLISGALGAVMAVSQSPWYGPYAALGMTPYGLSPAEDQQLAGVLMWVPGGLVHAGAALALLAPYLIASARPAQEKLDTP